MEGGRERLRGGGKGGWRERERDWVLTVRTEEWMERWMGGWMVMKTNQEGVLGYLNETSEVVGGGAVTQVADPPDQATYQSTTDRKDRTGFIYDLTFIRHA